MILKDRKPLMMGMLTGVATFLILGVPTALLPTGIFTRMIAPSLLDYVFLVLISAMLGAFIGFYVRRKRNGGREDTAAAGGTLIGALAIICPICNALLVSVFGAAFLLAWFDPARMFLGIISVLVLAGALYIKVKGNDCVNCNDRSKK